MNFVFLIGHLVFQLPSRTIMPGRAEESPTHRALLAVCVASLLLSSAAWAQISAVHVTSCGPRDFPGSTCTTPWKRNLPAVAWQSRNRGAATAKATSGGGIALNACDLNSDGTVNVADAQLSIDMDLALLPCTANIDGTGVCNVVVVQRVINAALGGPCLTGTGSNSHSVDLSWTASVSPNVASYNVYRGTLSGGPYTKLNSSPLGTAYTDTTVQAGQTYYYVATALDASNNESAYSAPPAAAIIPTP
jgi:hypothetical protein